jgi:hypothetical protein
MRDPDDFITHRELREAFKRLEEPLDFFEQMDRVGLKELLPELLKDERTRQVLKQVSGANWTKWRNRLIIVGALLAIMQIVEVGLGVIVSVRVLTH